MHIRFTAFRRGAVGTYGEDPLASRSLPRMPPSAAAHSCPDIAIPRPRLAAHRRCTVLLAPGSGALGSGGSFDAFQQVHADWNTPDLEAWAWSITAAARRAAGPVVIVAQGLACLATLRAGRLQPGVIAGALLLAPADPVRLGLTEPAWNEAPGFPAVVVADADDAGRDPAQAWSLALRWDCQLAGVGRRPDRVLGLLEQLCRRVAAPA